jgi:hypothetical protein
MRVPTNLKDTVAGEALVIGRLPIGARHSAKSRVNISGLCLCGASERAQRSTDFAFSYEVQTRNSRYYFVN